MQKLNDNPILNLNPRMQLKVSPQSSSKYTILETFIFFYINFHFIKLFLMRKLEN